MVYRVVNFTLHGIETLRASLCSDFMLRVFLNSYLLGLQKARLIIVIETLIALEGQMPISPYAPFLFIRNIMPYRLHGGIRHHDSMHRWAL